jgi:hypothetical protein
MQTSIRDIETRNPMYLSTAYRYDQLNRLFTARAFGAESYNLGTNSWSKTGGIEKYFNQFSYDANGNILTQVRKDANGATIDDLTYQYHRNSNGKILRNRLYHLQDAVQTADELDLEDMGAFIQHAQNTNINGSNNYVYDQEGRLIKDKAEGITIDWRVDGKVKRITDLIDNQPSDGIAQPHKYVEFDYDAMEEQAQLVKTRDPPERKE